MENQEIEGIRRQIAYDMDMVGVSRFCNLSHICKINQPEGCIFGGDRSLSNITWVRNRRCNFPVEIVASNLSQPV